MLDPRLKKLIDEQDELEKIAFRNDEEEERLIQIKEEIKLILEDQIRDLSKGIGPLPPKVFESPKPKYSNEDYAAIAAKYKIIHPEEEKVTLDKNQKKRKRTLFEWIMEKRREKRERNKATPEQVAQLRLEAKKARLEAQIAINKKKTKENKPSRFSLGIPAKIFTDEGAASYRRDKKALGGNHDDRDYSTLLGNRKNSRL